MNFETFITCAVTGSGATADKHPDLPITPEQIANAAIEAARAGAAIAHIHVRDPETGKGSRDVALYREVVERMRASDTDVVINLTAGMGGDMVFGPGETPAAARSGRDRHGRPDGTPAACPGTAARNLHARLRDDEFRRGGDYVMTNTPGMLRAMAAEVQRLGVRPELEVFDTGHLVFVKELIARGLLDDPVMIQLCLGIPYGAPDDPLTVMAMVHQLPPGAVFSGFSIGRKQLPFVAMAALAGGNVRVGLEDNLYLGKGELASNGQLVERAVQILTGMGARMLGPDAVRAKLKLTKR